jgi:hypothetical protein
MEKARPAANPDAYVAALTGWRRECVETLQRAAGGSHACRALAVSGRGDPAARGAK